jgi:hypothetical protein
MKDTSTYLNLEILILWGFNILSSAIIMGVRKYLKNGTIS